MPSPGQTDAIAGFSGHFNDGDAFASALVGGAFDYVPIPGQVFDARLRVLKLGPLVIQVAEQNAHSTHGAMDRPHTALILPLNYAETPSRMNGTEVAASEAFLAPGGVAFHGHTAAPVAWAALALPGAMLESLAELAPRPVRRPGEAGVLALPPAPAARLVGAMEAAARMAEDLPAALAAPDTVEGLILSLQEMLAETLTAEARLLPTPRATREAMRVVRAVEDILAAHPGQPLYREQLCEQLGISLRKLHDAFIATVGMSPQAYLKMRRLLLARRALQCGVGGAALVKSAALSHGFWHLGHFARDYREQFDESPSETRGRVAEPRRGLQPLRLAGRGFAQTG